MEALSAFRCRDQVCDQWSRIIVGKKLLSLSVYRCRVQGQKHYDRHNLSLSYKILIIMVSIFKPNVLVLSRQGDLFYIFSHSVSVIDIPLFFVGRRCQSFIIVSCSLSFVGCR